MVLALYLWKIQSKEDTEVKTILLLLSATLGLFGQGILYHNPQPGRDPLLQEIANYAHPCADDVHHMQELRMEINLQLKQGSVLPGAIYDYLLTEAGFTKRLPLLEAALQNLDAKAQKSPRSMTTDAISFRATGQADLKAIVAEEQQAINLFKPTLSEAWENAFGFAIPKDPLLAPEFRHRKPKLQQRYSQPH